MPDATHRPRESANTIAKFIIPPVIAFGIKIGTDSLGHPLGLDWYQYWALGFLIVIVATQVASRRRR